MLQANTIPTELLAAQLPVSDFQIFIKPCSIESRNDPGPISEVVNETFSV